MLGLIAGDTAVRPAFFKRLQMVSLDTVDYRSVLNAPEIDAAVLKSCLISVNPLVLSLPRFTRQGILSVR